MRTTLRARVGVRDWDDARQGRSRPSLRSTVLIGGAGVLSLGLNHIVSMTLIVAAGVMAISSEQTEPKPRSGAVAPRWPQDLVVGESGRLPEDGRQEQQGTGDELESDGHGGGSPSGVVPGSLPDGQHDAVGPGTMSVISLALATSSRLTAAQPCRSLGTHGPFLVPLRRARRELPTPHPGSAKLPAV